MSRFVLQMVAALVVACFSMSVVAEELPPPLVESYLHQGKFAEGEAALSRGLDANPNDDEARFSLGIVQFFRAVENLGQALHEYGAISENSNAIFLRLPVPKMTIHRRLATELSAACLMRLLRT